MQNLRLFRERKNLSQQELSQLAGVAQSVISDIENGVANPTVRTVSKLAKALGVTVSELIGDTIKA